ncbi:MAG: hypothetical protein WCP95_14380 [Actinomycetes bacterium]
MNRHRRGRPPVQAPAAFAVAWSDTFGRGIRQQGSTDLGRSTFGLAADAAATGAWEDAEALLVHAIGEVTRVNAGLLQWAIIVLETRTGPDVRAASAIGALGSFPAGFGPRASARHAIDAHDPEAFHIQVEAALTEVRIIHDQFVWWIQTLLTEVANTHGEEAAIEALLEVDRRLWSEKFAIWGELSPQERLWLSAETARANLAGPLRDGELNIVETESEYRIRLAPCGGCGVLRQGDPKSGRQMNEISGPTVPLPWLPRDRPMSWFAAHTPLVMSWLQVSAGQQPRRPARNCDSALPCEWLIIKSNSDGARPGLGPASPELSPERT